jgi:hypothetical protein
MAEKAMPVNIIFGALLMSGAIQSAQPATKLSLGSDAISKSNGGPPTVVLASHTMKKHRTDSTVWKGGPRCGRYGYCRRY